MRCQREHASVNAKWDSAKTLESAQEREREREREGFAVIKSTQRGTGPPETGLSPPLLSPQSATHELWSRYLAMFRGNRITIDGNRASLLRTRRSNLGRSDRSRTIQDFHHVARKFLEGIARSVLDLSKHLHSWNRSLDLWTFKRLRWAREFPIELSESLSAWSLSLDPSRILGRVHGHSTYWMESRDRRQSTRSYSNSDSRSDQTTRVDQRGGLKSTAKFRRRACTCCARRTSVCVALFSLSLSRSLSLFRYPRFANRDGLYASKVTGPLHSHDSRAARLDLNDQVLQIAISWNRGLFTVRWPSIIVYRKLYGLQRFDWEKNRRLPVHLVLRFLDPLLISPIYFYRFYSGEQIRWTRLVVSVNGFKNSTRRHLARARSF